MDNAEEVIIEYQKQIADIYKSRSLGCLSGIDLKFEVNGRQILVWYFKAVRRGIIANKSFDFQKSFDDLLFCSDEILHFTALLFLYQPYMNNPLKEGYQLGEKMVYPNRQNLASKRYAMYANSLSEKVYNYWDRIGDLLAAYFPDKIDPKQIYFGKTVDNIPNEFHGSANYKWLKEFKETEYKKINDKRKQIVHYITLDTQFKHTHLEYSDNKSMLEDLIKERDNLPEFFKGQIQFTLTGFEKTIALIEEISEVNLKEIE